MDNAAIKTALGFPQMSDEDLEKMVGGRAEAAQTVKMGCGIYCGHTSQANPICG